MHTEVVQCHTQAPLPPPPPYPMSCCISSQRCKKQSNADTNWYKKNEPTKQKTEERRI